MQRLLRAGLESSAVHSLVHFIEDRIPVVRAWHACRYDEYFARRFQWARMYRGVYHSFDEAIRAAPKTLPIGYDNQETASHIYEHSGLLESDYPMLFWLRANLHDNASIFDFGGNWGISFYLYEKYLTYPAGLKWTICDVPKVVAFGKHVAQERHRAELSFTTEFEQANGADICIAGASIQFVEHPFAQLLSRLSAKPTHLLINKLPLYEGETFVTLQHLGPAICPYYVFNKQEFINSVTALGYVLADFWPVAELSCYIPFHPEKWVSAFSGLYFTLQPAKSPAPNVAENGAGH